MTAAWDFLFACIIALTIAWAFLNAFLVSADALAENLVFAEKQRNALLYADLTLKKCFPQGIAFCEGGFLFSHKAHQDANLSLGKGGFCVKRIVLQNDEEKVLSACV